MFRLPVCPYCHTIYRYNKVRKLSKKEKTQVCYHCKKEFRVKRFKGMVVLGAIILAAAVATNLVLLYNLTSLDLSPIIISTVAYVLAGLILIPFFIDFKKINKTEQTDLSKKKSNGPKRK